MLSHLFVAIVIGFMFISVPAHFYRLFQGPQNGSLSLAKMLLVSAFAVLVSWAFMPFSDADVVYLKNESGNPETEKFMEGIVTKVSEDEVVIKTTDGVSMPLSRKSVSRIVFKPLRIEPTQGATTTTSATNTNAKVLEPLTSEPVVSGHTTTTEPNYVYGDASTKTATTTSQDFTAQPAQRPL